MGERSIDGFLKRISVNILIEKCNKDKHVYLNKCLSICNYKRHNFFVSKSS